MGSKIVWNSKVTTTMVKGWGDDAVADLVQALDEAVEQVFSDIADQYESESDDD